jgi:molecular chaperone DnaK
VEYVGIDLGTTNSAIASYDGEAVALYKSPEQHDVTPSAIFIDRRGNKFVGSRAYANAARNPDNAATLFKRIMGTSTPVRLAAVDKVMTPEECSAEVLRTVFGYLPEAMRRVATRAPSSRFQPRSTRCRRTRHWRRQSRPASVG